MRDTLAMYPWPKLRRILVVLLLLPVIHFVLMLANDLRSILDPEPTVWESEVSSLELRNSLNPPEALPLVIIGGRQAKLWRGLDNVLLPMEVVNNGVGSANVDDVLFFFDRLVRPFEPRAVIMVPGPSDFMLRDHKSPEEFMLMIKGLANYVTRMDSKPHFYVLTLNKWPRFPRFWATVDAANNALERWAEGRPDVTLIDTRAAFEQARGLPVRQVFRADGINLNDWGYMQLSLLLRQQLEADYPHFYQAAQVL
jgi:hypothetical protein